MVYKYLGWGITNENGVAHLDHDAQGQEIEHSYTGVGAGEVDVVASLDNPIVDGSIVSGTYNVWDTIMYDDNTGNFYYTTTFNVTVQDDGTLLSYPVDYGTIYAKSNQQIHPIDSVMEFDVVSETGRVNMSFFNNSQTTKYSPEFNSFSNRGVGHWRVELTNTSIKLYRDGVEVTGSPISVDFGNNPIRVGFVGITASSTIKIANFKEYYL